MDRYFKVAPRNPELKPDRDLHLIGITCMFIASKFEEMKHLTLQTNIVSQVCQGKFTASEVKDCETRILKALSYRISAPTVWDFTEPYISKLSSIARVKPTLLEAICLYLAQLVMHEYRFLHLRPSLLSAAVTYVAFRILENYQTPSLLITGPLLDAILEITSPECHGLLVEAAQRLILMTQRFELAFPDCPDLANASKYAMPRIVKELH